MCSAFLYCFCQALQKGNIEGARIHAENSIRQKNQVHNDISIVFHLGY